MPRALLVLAVAVALSGCAGTREETKPPTELELRIRSAQLAFSRGHYAQAATLYQAALDQALVEDDPEAIVDARFNLALAQTYLGRYPQALELVTLAEAERVRRALGPDPGLQLLRATIHYRAGDPAAAQRALEPLLGDPTPPASTAARAHFLAGVMAADRNDASALKLHRAALPAGEARSEEADRLELDGRLAAIEGDVEEALRRLDRTALLRSEDGDYRGVVRTLAAAGSIAERAGHVQQAAGYFLRAGRSGLQRAEPQARAWLEQARTLGSRAGDAVLIREADAMLARLGTPQDAKR